MSPLEISTDSRLTLCIELHLGEDDLHKCCIYQCSPLPHWWVCGYVFISKVRFITVMYVSGMCQPTTSALLGVFGKAPSVSGPCSRHLLHHYFRSLLRALQVGSIWNGDYYWNSSWKVYAWNNENGAGNLYPSGIPKLQMGRIPVSSHLHLNMCLAKDVKPASPSWLHESRGM